MKKSQINLRDFRMFTDSEHNNVEIQDKRKYLAESIYNECEDLVGHNLAMKMYNSEMLVEMNEEETELLLNHVKTLPQLFQDSLIENLVLYND